MCQTCPWAQESPLMQSYHDQEWGVVSQNDAYLFEMLILEGQQAGLSWKLILERREGMRKALDNFDWRLIKDYEDKDLQALKENPVMIRNRLKIQAIRKNAQAFERVREEWGSFANYIWHFSQGKRLVNHYQKGESLPATSPLSETISKDLKKRGFNFVGPTIIYSYLQAIGMIDDHLDSCFCKNLEADLPDPSLP